MARSNSSSAAWQRSTFEGLSTYLPVLLMALMALGTWWLVKNTPIFEPPRPAAAPRHEPDYTMDVFTVRRYDRQGTLRSQVQGDEARHYPDTDLLEVDNVRLRAVGEQGEITTAQAHTGWTNRDGSEVRLQGEAVVERAATGAEPAVTFHGESLTALVKAQKVLSKEPVTIERAELRVVADTMNYDHATRVAQTQGRVHATFTGAAGQ
ncbi:MAG: LPS export ABC transporter periplasmic protein LptC [Pseudomonadota bacterium]